jgi:hypothetical protein
MKRMHIFGNHPLDGAILRWTRADIHLAEAGRLVEGWGESCKKTLRRDSDGEYRLVGGYPPIPPLLPVVVSDIIHNLRAALDYIVYELAIKDSGSIQDGTQFLIEDVKSDPSNPRRGFDARNKQCLKGLNAAHVSAIERLQPYNGVKWTETLREISNPDKHRHLSVLSTEGRQVDFRMDWTPDGEFEGKDFEMTSEGPRFPRFNVKFDGQNTIAITLPKVGTKGVLPLLHSLEAEVGSTIELFKPEF